MLQFATEQREVRIRMLVEASKLDRFRGEALGQPHVMTGRGGDGLEATFTDDKLRCVEVIRLRNQKVPDGFAMVEVIFRTAQWR